MAAPAPTMAMTPSKGTRKKAAATNNPASISQRLTLATLKSHLTTAITSARRIFCIDSLYLDRASRARGITPSKLLGGLSVESDAGSDVDWRICTVKYNWLIRWSFEGRVAQRDTARFGNFVVRCVSIRARADRGN